MAEIGRNKLSDELYSCEKIFIFKFELVCVGFSTIHIHYPISESTGGFWHVKYHKEKGLGFACARSKAGAAVSLFVILNQQITNTKIP